VPIQPNRDAAVLAYAAALLLAAVQAAVLGAPARTLQAAVPYAVGLAVILTLRAVGPASARGPAEATWLRAVAWASLALAGWALATFLVALPGQLGEPHSFYRVKVAVSTPLGDHNTAAGSLLVGIVACAVLAAQDRRWLAGSAVVALGLIATLSRGAAAVLLLVALLGTWVASARAVRMVLAGSAVVVGAGVLLAAAVLDASPPPGAPDPDGPVGASIVGRADLAARGVAVGAANPVLGTGLGSFEEQATGLPPPNDHAHQLFAHALAEGGVPLLVVAVVLPLVLAVRGWRWRVGPTRELVLLGGAALVGHAQLEILGGRLGYELVLAALAGLVTPRVRSPLHDAAREPR
jgi:hypothetical protein